MGKYYLASFGCQMNKNDSQRIEGLMEKIGLTAVKKVDKADLIIVNTCSVRQSAEDRVYGFIHNWQALRKTNPNLIIAVTGCMPGRDHDDKIGKKIKGVDLFFGINELVMFPKFLYELNPSLCPDFNNDEYYLRLEQTDYLQIEAKNSNTFKAFITIQSGCSNYCTYCVVPYARGKERNRTVNEILGEIKILAKNGCKEVTLLGQVVNNFVASDKENFSKDNPFQNSFAALLYDINKIEEIERIDFTASDPHFFNDEQIEALKLSKLMNSLHLPVQSGSDEILKKMNRNYNSQEYINLVAKIKKAKPDIALSTDIIVGFCGETEEQFNDTIELYKACQFDICYTAMYSSRSATVAAKIFEDTVSYRQKKKRWRTVQELMEKITFEKNQKYLNKNISVLVDECKNGICSGRSRELKLVQFVGKESLVGTIVDINVKMAGVWLLKGEVKK